MDAKDILEAYGEFRAGMCIDRYVPLTAEQKRQAIENWCEPSPSPIVGRDMVAEFTDPTFPYSVEVRGPVEVESCQGTPVDVSKRLRFDDIKHVDVMETRHTDPDTGGQKGIKQERFDLMPTEALEEIARVFGWGAGKYDDDNWRKGYKWGYSFGALMRHAWAFWRGEDRDQESGLHHLAHVAWHCLVMMTFDREGLGKDDRR